MDGHEHDDSEHYAGDTHPPSPADPDFSDDADFYDSHGPFWESDHSDHPLGAADHEDPDWLTEDSADHPHSDAPDLYSDAPPPAGEPDHEFATHPVDGAHEPSSPSLEPPPDHEAEAPAEPSFGADPDLPASTHSMDAWLDLPVLDHLTVPEPTGGAPWVEVDLLGPADAADPTYAMGPADTVAGQPVGALDDLRAALGEPPLADAPDSAFQELLTSDDPAVRALAHLWASPA